MANQEDDLLAKELGKLGSLGGKIGGGTAGAIGGALGAKLIARFVPTERCQRQVEISCDAKELLPRLASFLSSQGRLADDREAGASRFPKLSAIMGSGFLKMNPTLLHVEVIRADRGRCSLLVTGAAKEGLIRQRSAEKAVNRVVEFLQNAD